MRRTSSSARREATLEPEPAPRLPQPKPPPAPMRKPAGALRSPMSRTISSSLAHGRAEVEGDLSAWRGQMPRSQLPRRQLPRSRSSCPQGWCWSCLTCVLIHTRRPICCTRQPGGVITVRPEVGRSHASGQHCALLLGGQPMHSRTVDRIQPSPSSSIGECTSPDPTSSTHPAEPQLKYW